MWFVLKIPAHEDNATKIGRCRKRAPTMDGYPVVFARRGWCGDHKLDENTEV
jgi:hypothetical protein